MTDVIVSFRVDKKLHQRMKAHKEINWSEVLRQAVERRVPLFDREKALAAARDMDYLRESGAFSHGKPSLELIKEWREKRTKRLLTHQ